MKWIIQIFGAFLMVAGVLFLFDPQSIFGALESRMEQTSFYLFAIGTRLVLGVVFLKAARKVRFPLFFRVFGFLLLASAVVFSMIGHEQFIELCAYIIPRAQQAASAWAILILGFGAFLIYACTGKKISN